MSQLKELEKLLVDFRDQRDWQQFDNPKDLAIALSLEAGELLEVFLWKPSVTRKMEKVTQELADDLVIGDGRWVCRPERRASSDKSIHGLKALLKRDPQRGQEMAELIIKNTYRTLMTRGMKGCLVFSTDKETRAWMRGEVSR
jgi:hypothetical protein